MYRAKTIAILEEFYGPHWPYRLYLDESRKASLAARLALAGAYGLAGLNAAVVSARKGQQAPQKPTVTTPVRVQSSPTAKLPKEQRGDKEGL